MISSSRQLDSARPCPVPAEDLSRRHAEPRQNDADDDYQPIRTAANEKSVESSIVPVARVCASPSCSSHLYRQLQLLRGDCAHLSHTVWVIPHPLWSAASHMPY